MSQLQVNRINDASGGVLAPISSVMRNRLINGQMTIDQRNNGASYTVPTGSSYSLDRWFEFRDTSGGAFTIQQSTTAPIGFKNSLLVTVTATDALASGAQFQLTQFIEGNNVSDLGWGTANAATVTLSFWVRSSLTGTFAGSLANSAANRAYVFTYNISAANTWEQKSVTITGDTSGTWLTDNGIGIRTIFNLGSGSNFRTTAGVWSGTYGYNTSGAVNLISTNGATLAISGVQLERGTQATSFEYRQYQQELALCQRYAFMLAPAESGMVVTGVLGFDSTRAFDGSISAFPVTMRAKPTATASGTWDTVDGTATQGSQPLGFVPVGTYGYRGVIGSGGSGLVANRYFLARTASTTSQVLFNAEL
jgi:hypothetical protein